MAADALMDALGVATQDCADCRALYLVGGAVRDQQRGEALGGLRDLDFVVEGSAEALGRLLVARHGGDLSSHERFGTATWVGPLWPTPLDFVSARRERYLRPGELPTVEPGSIEDDLRRRDFTVNSMAMRIAPGERGQIVDPSGGLDDLRDGILRIHHPGSFLDDATRMLRLARFAVRLDLSLDDDTAVALGTALADAAIEAVSGDRLWAEWVLLCAESAPSLVMTWLQDHGIGDALVPGMGSSSIGPLRRGLAASNTARPWQPLQSLAVVLGKADPDLAAARFGLHGAPASKLHRWAAVVDELSESLAADSADDQLENLLRHTDAQDRAVLVACVPAVSGAVLRYETKVISLAPLLNGADLLAAGMDQGQAVGEALRLVRAGQLRGELSTSDDALELLGLCRSGE